MDRFKKFMGTELSRHTTSIHIASEFRAQWRWQKTICWQSSLTLYQRGAVAWNIWAEDLSVVSDQIPFRCGVYEVSCPIRNDVLLMCSKGRTVSRANAKEWNVQQTTIQPLSSTRTLARQQLTIISRPAATSSSLPFVLITNSFPMHPVCFSLVLRCCISVR